MERACYLNSHSHPSPMAGKKRTTARARKAPTTKRMSEEGRIVGAQLAMELPRPGKAGKKRKKKVAERVYTVVLDYRKGRTIARRNYTVKDDAVFHSIVLMLRTGPTYLHTGENAISLAATPPSSAPAGTASASVLLALP